jgi:hypothetical protein
MESLKKLKKLRHQANILSGREKGMFDKKDRIGNVWVQKSLLNVNNSRGT